MNNKLLKILAIVIVLLLIGGILFFIFHGKPASKKPTTTTTSQFTQLNIQLKDGEPISAPSTYLVKPGTGLEFTIESDVFGKVGVPTNPPQIITFTQSPLVFKFKASTTAGNYPLSYQANGSDKVIQIGTIVVR